MGVVFLAYASLPSGAVYAFAWFNFFMHTYIVVFIGISNGIHTFVPWNAMCVALSALIFGQEQLGEVSAASHLQPHHFILLILLHAPPILQLFGKIEFGTLSHSARESYQSTSAASSGRRGDDGWNDAGI